MLAGEIARRFGAEGLAAGSLLVEMEGIAGQSFGRLYQQRHRPSALGPS